MKINVYLDDVRPCPPGFVVARNGEECLELLRSCEVVVLSMDHDLGWDRPNGTEIARNMAAEGIYADEIFLHSSSPTGRMNMFQILYKHKPEHVRIHLYEVPNDRLAAIERSAREENA